MDLNNRKKILISMKPGGMILLSFPEQAGYGKVGLLVPMVMERFMYLMNARNYLLEKVGTKHWYQTMKLRDLEKSGERKEMRKIDQCF
jgi:hypothetical protein